MSVVEGSGNVDFSPKLSLKDNEMGEWNKGTKRFLLFAVGVVLAAALTSAVVVTTYMLYIRGKHEDTLVRFEPLDTTNSASYGTLDFMDENGRHGHEEIYVNDVTREHIIQVAHPHYDIFIVKKFNEGREMTLMTTKPKEGQLRRVLDCEETNLTDTEFISSSQLLNTVLTQPPEVTVAEQFRKTSLPIKLAYTSCDKIPLELFRAEVPTVPNPDEIIRRKRQAESYGNWQDAEQTDKWGNKQTTKYGNWGSRWNSRNGPFPSCCEGCKHRQQCSALTCSPPLDALDRSCMDYTFCTQCWRQTPTTDIPHCDCIRDFMNDINSMRCPSDNYKSCYFYRNSLKGIMPSHRCWGRMVTKSYHVYHCGYKQTQCDKGRCKIQPEYCVRGRTKVRNNFKCQNYLMCEESTRHLSGGNTAMMTNFKY